MDPDPRRLLLQTLLEELLGSRNVYFQPPDNLQMNYPCIVYQRARPDTEFANNSVYHYRKRYTVTHIGRDPDSDVPDKLAKLPLCAYDRFFVADNLNHDVLNLFF